MTSLIERRLRDGCENSHAGAQEEFDASLFVVHTPQSFLISYMYRGAPQVLPLKMAANFVKKRTTRAIFGIKRGTKLVFGQYWGTLWFVGCSFH